MKKLIVLYLSSAYTNIENLNNFIKYYKKFRPGIKHDLIICFKNLSLKELKRRKKF